MLAVSTDVRLVQGLWQRGKASGPGRYKWKNGNEYDGEWQLGRMHGQGTLKWLSGNCPPKSQPPPPPPSLPPKMSLILVWR